MARILRGEIRWADLSGTKGHEQAGRRPVVIVSHDVFNERSGTAIVLAVTSQPQKVGFPLVLELNSDTLPKQSWVKMNQIRTISAERMGEVLGYVASEQMAQIIEGLNEIISD